MKKVMKRILTAAMLILVSTGAVGQVRVDFNETYTGGTIVEKGQSKPADDGSVVVTITVTPDKGYTIAKEDVVVVLTRSTSQTRDENPSIAEALQLEGDDPANLGDERDYSFTVAAGFGAWVMEATFHKTDDANDISDDDSQVEWTLKEGTLTISGTGGTKDFDSDDTPWNDADVTSVVISKDVTSLGAGIFAGCTNLTSIIIDNAKQVLALGEGAIPANEGLQIRVPFNLQNEYWITSGWGDFKYDSEGATLMDITFSAKNQYDTFAADKEALVVPSVLSAYIITGIDGNSLNLSKVNVITPGMAVVVFNERELENTNFVTATTSAEPSRSANFLHVASEKMEVKLGEVFLLYNDVFYYSQAGIIPQGGIYLENASPANTRSFYSLNGDGGTTAVSPIYINKVETQSSWYTLDGRRLDTKPTRPGLYIKAGKIMLIK